MLFRNSVQSTLTMHSHDNLANHILNTDRTKPLILCHKRIIPGLRCLMFHTRCVNRSDLLRSHTDQHLLLTPIDMIDVVLTTHIHQFLSLAVIHVVNQWWDNYDFLPFYGLQKCVQNFIMSSATTFPERLINYD